MRIVNIKDLKVGQVECKRLLVSQKRIEEFASLTEDFNPLHTNEDFGLKTQFESINAQGMLLVSLIIGVVGTSLPGAGWMCLGVDSTFNLPVLPDDQVDVDVTVKQKAEALGVAVLEGRVLLSNGSVACRAEIKVKQLEWKS